MAQQTSGFKQDAWKILLSVCALMLTVGALYLLMALVLTEVHIGLKIVGALWLLTGHICLWQPLLAYRYGADRLYRCGMAALMVQTIITAMVIFEFVLPSLPEPLEKSAYILFCAAWMLSPALLPPTLARKPKAG